MKKLFLVSVAATLISSLSFAKIRRVNYPGTYLLEVDYPDLTTANNEANPGDTIQVYGNFGGSNITKQLVIIGFGSNFDVNPGLQAVGGDLPSLGSINFYEGSSGSFVTGVAGSFTIDPLDPTTGITSGTGLSNITFQRCRGNFYLNNYPDANHGPLSNIKIYSSIVENGGTSYSQAEALPVTNVQVYNCIVNNFNMYKPGSSAAFINCVGGSLSYAGNSINLNDAGCLIKNCIFASSYATNNINTVYENNFFQESQPAGVIPGSNNRWSQDWAVIFTRNGASGDDQSYVYAAEFDEDFFTLKAGSPAINGGFNAANTATNCGIYGGEAAYVYKLSGVPAVPSIYQLTAPSANASSNPYNVTISVKSNN